MNIFKERIIGAVTVMSSKDLEKLWTILKNEFNNPDWNSIEEVEPDKIDLKMLSEINSDKDCKSFVSEEETLKHLGIHKKELF